MSKNNIVLIGFMGVGKTSVGKIVAEKLKYKFVDTDLEIQKESKMTIEEIFSKFGEEYFRKIESSVVERVSKLNSCVISTGGGVILNIKNMKTLRNSGIIFLIRASKEKILNNIMHSDNRPLLEKTNLEASIDNLLKEREGYYKDYDFEIPTDNMNINQVAESIIQLIKENTIQ